MERGFYAPQARCANANAAVHYLRTDGFWIDPSAEIARITRFLGIDDIRCTPTPVDYVVPVDSSGMPPISEEDRAYLLDLYAADIAETERMTGPSV